VLDGLKVSYEILIVTQDPDDETLSVAGQFGAEVVEQRERGYGGALLAGVETARAPYLLTMDADLSHRPFFIRDLWSRRHLAEVTIASRYIAGGSARMPVTRYLLSRILNALFRIGLSLPIHDMSSGFRLYKADVLADMIKAGGQGHGHHKDEYQERYETSGIRARDFDILQEILVRAYADGWKIAEVPFKYSPRKHGSSHARILRFGRAYLRSFWPLWQMRNSVLSADYDDRAYNSRIYLQRYWQRSRFRHITELIAGRGPVLDVGCGSSRIIGALPPGSVALDLLPHKLRYARKFSKPLVQASGFHLPFPTSRSPV
jgi:dolichol-phosphate mannosyltransferase